jgi:hypothetical protein
MVARSDKTRSDSTVCVAYIFNEQDGRHSKNSGTKALIEADHPMLPRAQLCQQPVLTARVVRRSAEATQLIIDTCTGATDQNWIVG